MAKKPYGEVTKDIVHIAGTDLNGHKPIYVELRKVVGVNFMTSRVLLLSDLNSKIPVTIEPGGIQSILSGNGVSDGVIQYTKGKMPINGEGVVYTSGTGGLLKSGIPIGKIKHNENKNNVDFFVDFSQLRFVRILSYSEEKN